MQQSREAPLLLVSLALPQALRGIPHVVQFVSDLLTPLTIDSAVYNDLPRVLATHGAFRVWTVSAMDGAAARGRLDVLEWLRVNRTEGCSYLALDYAAINNHLDVVAWLCWCYPRWCRPGHSIVLAAKTGHGEVVKFLKSRVNRHDFVVAMKVAAANDQAGVVEAVLPLRRISTKVFGAAAEKGHTNVLKMLIANDGLGVDVSLDQLLRRAVHKGDVEVARLLVENCSDGCICTALEDAAASHRVAMMKVLLEERYIEHIGYVLEKIAARKQYDAVTLLLEKCSTRDVSEVHIDKALYEAEKGGQTKLVRLIVGKCGEGAVSGALVVAVHNNRIDILKLFLKEHHHLEIGPALEEAAFTNQCEMIKVLLENWIAIDIVCEPDIYLAQIQKELNFLSPRNFIGHAFRSAAKGGRVEVVRLLIKHCVPDIGIALCMAVSHNELGVVKSLLNTCESKGWRENDRIGAISIVSDIAPLIHSAEMAKLLVCKYDVLSAGRALTVAITGNNLELVNSLADKSNSRDIQDALVAAARNDQFEVAEVLVKRSDHGSMKEFVDAMISPVSLEMSAYQLRKHILEDTVKKGCMGLVEQLMENAGTSDVDHGLEVAAKRGNVEMLKVLLAGSDLKGVTSAVTAAISNDQLDVVHFLLTKHINGVLSYTMNETSR